MIYCTTHYMIYCTTHDMIHCTTHDRIYCTTHDRIYCTTHDRIYCTTHARIYCTTHDRIYCTTYDRIYCTQLFFSALTLLMKQAARPNSLLQGCDRTVQYLQHLGNSTSYTCNIRQLYFINIRKREKLVYKDLLSA